MVTITKPTVGSYWKCLFQAPSGHGKTYLLGTAQDDPRTSPILILDFEGGSRTLAGRDVDVAQIRSWTDYNEIYDLLQKGSAYKSIGIDSLSETAVFSLLNILDTEAKKITDVVKHDEREVSTQIQDYGKATIQLRRLVRAFRDLPYHVFFTCITKDAIDPSVGSVKVPGIFGQAAEEIPAMMDLNGYLALGTDPQGKVQRILLLQNYPKFRVKVREPYGEEVPNELEDPTITKLFDALKVPQVTGKVVQMKQEGV